MTEEQIINRLTSHYSDNQPFTLALAAEKVFEVYPQSINQLNENFVFIARLGKNKFLITIVFSGNPTDLRSLQSAELIDSYLQEGTQVQLALMNSHNAIIIRKLFAFTRPVLIGLQDSYGLGDRLGNANPAHLRAIAGTGMRPVLAQQSIRELQRTQRTPEEVIDAATWAVLQEGYKEGFGADADHLKTTEDIDLMARAGFTMFTFDPGEYVIDAADTLAVDELPGKIQSLPWTDLDDEPEGFISRYDGQSFAISDDFTLKPDKEQVLRGLLKYGGVIAHTARMYRYLKENYPNHPCEIELSVDETESVTSPFEHFLVATELNRLGVKLVSLAPRFVGDFEKGIDYKGDLVQFREEYLKHVKIAEKLGPYKISIHSGSDKFSVYEVIGSLKSGRVHVKTAGTSYLEALRTVAATLPDLFREILDFARGLYEAEKRTYHVSADLEKVPAAGECSDADLLQLFEQNDARQVLHVTFGKVLTSTDDCEDYLFRDRIMDCLNEHETVHYEFLQKHFRRHLEPFQ